MKQPNNPFAIKALREALTKLQDSQYIGTQNIIRVEPIGEIKKPVKIGELFGCEVYSDPWLPKDTFVMIQKKSEFQDGRAKRS